MKQRWQRGLGCSGPGRPACRLDELTASSLVLSGATYAETARYLGCDRKTLVRHCGEVLRRAVERRRALRLPRFLWQRGRESLYEMIRGALDRPSCLDDLQQLERGLFPDLGNACTSPAHRRRSSAREATAKKRDSAEKIAPAVLQKQDLPGHLSPKAPEQTAQVSPPGPPTQVIRKTTVRGTASYRKNTPSSTSRPRRQGQAPPG